LLADGEVIVDHETYPMEQAAGAWAAQTWSPGGRLLIEIG
jgi:hypothetical protein